MHEGYSGWSFGICVQYKQHMKKGVLGKAKILSFLDSISVGDYGKWMNDLLELYDGVIFARKSWKGVAFNLD